MKFLSKKNLSLLQERQRYRQNSRLRKIYGQEYTPWQVNVHWTQKVGVFSLRILDNVLYLNKQLYKMNPSVSPLCSFCLKEQETFTHLFLECSYSSNLWRELRRSLSPKLSLQNLNVKNLTVGFIENKSTHIIVNHILLLFKRYIYLPKLENNSVHFVGFKFFTRTFMKVEEKISKRKGTLALHYQKWDAVREILLT